jgi:hypothetical protein
MRRSTRQDLSELTHDLEVRTDANHDCPENPTNGVCLAFPEGGREAWMCLLGSCLMMFPSFGFQTAGEALWPILS